MVGRQRGFEVVSEPHRQHPDAGIQLPSRGSRHSAGYDLHTPVGFTLMPGARAVIVTDLKSYMLPDEVLSVYPRSSVGLRGVMLTNTVGIVDADYYANASNDGNIRLSFHNIGPEAFTAQAGDRIAQAIFTKYLLADGDGFAAGPERLGGQGHTGR
ncbi:dCTP deaminase domain-containing protein [Deinococcus frigens]|uniref:dCTP deaminase domain-containing protein n=1 Tax=Deinococcus frigens TaxID=249403 RepID=UPI000497B8DD|nr:deoxyuridine 5'-triphosphate nucleotidohydrolase [Deinococcus frigens]